MEERGVLTGGVRETAQRGEISKWKRDFQGDKDGRRGLSSPGIGWGNTHCWCSLFLRASWDLSPPPPKARGEGDFLFPPKNHGALQTSDWDPFWMPDFFRLSPTMGKDSLFFGCWGVSIFWWLRICFQWIGYLPWRGWLFFSFPSFYFI